MKKPLIAGLAILIPIIGYLSFSGGSPDAPVETPNKARPVPVTAETAGSRKEAHETMSFTGTVTAEGVADIIARTAGTVVESNPAIGDRIFEGSLLAVIDDRPGNPESYLGLRSPDIREAGLSVERAKKTYREAKRDDDRKSTHDTELAKDLAEADLSSAESALAAAMDAHVVRSPISGIVTGKSVSVNDTVDAGSKLLTIEKSGAKRIVRFFVGENARGLLRPGMPVEIAAEPGSDVTIGGKLLRVASSADTESRRFLAEAELHGTIASGTVVSVLIDVIRTAGPGNIILPLPSITFGQDGEKVFVAENGLAKEVPVSVIRIEGESAEISAPIDEGVHIIIGNAKRVKDGSEISVTDR